MRAGEVKLTGDVEGEFATTPNLLAAPGATITSPNNERVVQNDVKILYDGSPVAPPNL